jgi:hypothetical protein
MGILEGLQQHFAELIDSFERAGVAELDEEQRQELALLFVRDAKEIS